jgi:Rps23 Pro-64 3,4-dihydroxylase Tpa1-like proline 4-hydroxylase
VQVLTVALDVEPNFIDYERLEGSAELLRQSFNQAAPFRWLSVDGFLSDGAVVQLADGFEASMTRANKSPDVVKKHTHVLRKRGVVRPEQMEASHRQLFAELASERFLKLVSNFTGITPLYADADLMGGGLHEIFPGGYLNVHTDFNVHPRTGKHRRLNILIYLNVEWKEEWKGALELWPADNSACATSILPIGGRMVLFETSEVSFHGHPEPLVCPPGVTRKSIAAYYYSDWPTGVVEREKTNYRLTPSQRGARSKKGTRSGRPVRELWRAAISSTRLLRKIKWTGLRQFWRSRPSK